MFLTYQYSLQRLNREREEERGRGRERKRERERERERKIEVLSLSYTTDHPFYMMLSNNVWQSNYSSHIRSLCFSKQCYLLCYFVLYPHCQLCMYVIPTDYNPLMSIATKLGL